MIILDELNVCPALIHYIGSKTLKNGDFFLLARMEGLRPKLPPRLENFRALLSIIIFKKKTSLDAIVISLKTLFF